MNILDLDVRSRLIRDFSPIITMFECSTISQIKSLSFAVSGMVKDEYGTWEQGLGASMYDAFRYMTYSISSDMYQSKFKRYNFAGKK